MKLDIILIIGIVVNTMFAVLYPAQIFGDDPLGLSGVTDERINDYYTVNNSGIINSYDSDTQQLGYNNELMSDLSESVQVTDGSGQIFGSDLFAFIDWVSIGWKLLKTAMMFLIGFIVLLWNLVYPLNFLIGVPFSVLYIYAITKFIIGR